MSNLSNAAGIDGQFRHTAGGVAFLLVKEGHNAGSGAGFGNTLAISVGSNGADDGGDFGERKHPLDKYS